MGNKENSEKKMISETHIFRHESGPPFFSVLDFEKKNKHFCYAAQKAI